MRITGRDLRRIVREETRRMLSEAVDMPLDTEMEPEPRLEPEGGGRERALDFEVRTAYMSMRVKPVGFVVDVRDMEGTGGGEYPVYWANGTGISKICRTMGEGAFDLLDLAAEGRMPRGIFIAATDGEGGPLEIVNRV